MPSRTRPDADREGRRQALIAAADQLLMAQPYHRVRVEDIARAAGVAKGTVFLYFPNKESLTLSVFQERLERALSAASTRVAGVTNSGELHDALVDVFADVRDSVHMVPIYWAVLKHEAPPEQVGAFRETIALRIDEVARRAAETWPVPIDQIRTAIARTGLLLVATTAAGLTPTPDGGGWFSGIASEPL